MKIKWRQWKIIMTAVLGALLLTGCGLLSKENVKLRDLDFTVLSEEKIPEELKTVIAEKGTEPFQLTYSDNQNLYISIGYGEQKTGGYSIAVDALYLTDDAIHVSTSLLGPDITGQKEGAGKPSTPYIVLKTELLDKTNGSYRSIKISRRRQLIKPYISLKKKMVKFTTTGMYAGFSREASVHRIHSFFVKFLNGFFNFLSS